MSGPLVAARRPYLDGAWVGGDGGELPVRSPADESLVATVQAASVSQFGAAVAAARRAFDAGPWPQSSAADRVAALRRFGAALQARRAALVETIIAEAGCPRGVTEFAQVDMALASVGELADAYEAMPPWEHNRAPLRDHLVGSTLRMTIDRYEAAGVVAAISPYNFPLVTNVWKVVPALLAGCTVVLRPSPLTPLAAYVLGEAAEEAGLPPGVLNVLAETGNDGAVLLTTDPRVDVVTFTGSTAVGRAVAHQAAATLKRVVLELGGKSAGLYLPDVLAGGVGPVVIGAMTVFASHAGQGCSLQTRLLVPQDRVAEVIEALADAAARLPLGDPADPATVVGPLITKAQRQRVDDLVQRSVTAGARVVAGGRIPGAPARGWFYEPTVLDTPDPSNPANQEEFFGPVVSVLGYRDVEHAIALANDSSYGLSGGVYTGDLALGVEIASRIRTGTVQVNTGWAAGYTSMGGIGQSGYGQERGMAGIREFQNVKHLVIGSR